MSLSGILSTFKSFHEKYEPIYAPLAGIGAAIGTPILIANALFNTYLATHPRSSAEDGAPQSHDQADSPAVEHTKDSLHDLTYIH
ncbi:hypothetical protein [Rhodoligotrophos ferricapiens]|uniref:hypothetical protein n=1 Tax=Rhodoligotrophos ferricapiens TaxID=3069264 RepID=UPI00315D2BC7